MITTLNTFIYRVTSLVFVAMVFCELVSCANAAETHYPDNYLSTPDSCLDVINDIQNWDINKLIVMKPDNDAYRATELFGALRLSNDKIVTSLVNKSDQLTRSVGGLPRGLRDAFVVVALVRIDAPAIRHILALNANNFGFPKYSLSFYHALLPADSVNAIIDDFIYNNSLTDRQLNNLVSLKKDFVSWQNFEPEKLPPLSDFVLNHPLYKARQTVIDANIAIFKKQNRPAELDENLLTAVVKLGEVRSVEAVDVLAPYLLLKTKHGLKPANNIADKKLLSLQEYPVAVALAEIGIPSIWGLLDEIAKRERNGAEYRQVAYNVMTSILPQVAIPGFVNAALEKQTDEIAKIRLAKVFPIMGISDSPLLVPYARDWESTDGLFKTNAKFISLDKKEVTLEKADGKQTTIELSALRKEDQAYVKEQLALKPEKSKTDSSP